MGFSDYDDGDVAAADDGDGGSSKTIKPMRMTANMSKNMKTKPARRTMKLLTMAMVFLEEHLEHKTSKDDDHDDHDDGGDYDMHDNNKWQT